MTKQMSGPEAGAWARRADDAILVSLITHSLMASSDAEQRAARMLLDALRNGNPVEGLDAMLDVSDASDAGAVAAALRVLMDRYGLCEEAATGPAA